MIAIVDGKIDGVSAVIGFRTTGTSRTTKKTVLISELSRVLLFPMRDLDTKARSIQMSRSPLKTHALTSFRFPSSKGCFASLRLSHHPAIIWKLGALSILQKKNCGLNSGNFPCQKERLFACG